MSAGAEKSAAGGESRTSTSASILEAVARTLRQQVGPQVAEPFAQTQAFMAAVILEKTAGQLRAERTMEEVAGVERRELLTDLRALCPEPPPRLSASLEALAMDGQDARWSELVSALYAERAGLGPTFDPALARVRAALRARLDRVLAYAR